MAHPAQAHRDHALGGHNGGGAENRGWLKWGSLTGIVLQNTCVVTAVRFSREAHEDKYAATVAIFIVELLKLLGALGLFAWELRRGLFQMLIELWRRREDMLVLAIPSACYVANQNLVFWAADRLSAPALQVLAQTKLLWTAALNVLVLRKTFRCIQVVSFFVLLAGVATVQQEDKKATARSSLTLNASTLLPEAQQAGVLPATLEASHLVGVTQCVAAAALSGFAGVFLEKVYNQGSSSLWALNAQLASISLLVQAAAVMRVDGARLVEDGVFAGFHADTWAVILIQAFGGLLTGLVIKHAGTVLKAFATALAILSTCLTAMAISKYSPTSLFWLGVALVCTAICMYSAPATIKDRPCPWERSHRYESVVAEALDGPGGKKSVAGTPQMNTAREHAIVSVPAAPTCNAA